MSRIIFDIETVGMDFDSLDAAMQENLMRHASTKQEKADIIERLSLFPQTAQIVTIGLLNPDNGKGHVFFQTSGEPLLPFEEEHVRYETGTEKEILQNFWKTIRPYTQFITFNGRGFDCPFVMVRSAVHKVRPIRDLMPNRYHDTHIDLLDQLTFFGASRRRFSLDMWCRTFGIKSPKEEGVSGQDVKALFRAGRHIDIARYCVRDIRATGELLRYWEQYIRYSP